MGVKTDLRKFVIGWERGRKEIDLTARREFEHILRGVMREHELDAIVWRQYEPWNDGDETQFDIPNAILVDTGGLEEYGNDMLETALEALIGYDKEYMLDTGEEHETVLALLRNEQDFLEAIYGCAEVCIYADAEFETHVEEYSDN